MDVMARRRAIMAHIARLVKKIISSATGLVNFVTNVEEPIKVICSFSPVQSGTGDPSPENVRPISGWDGCEITKSNIAVDEATKEYIFSEIQEGSGDPSATNYRPIIPGLSITRDDNSVLNVYGGKLKVNADGTSVLTATRGILTWDSSRSPYALSGYPRTAVVWGSSTYLWGGSDHKCDRAKWRGYGIGGFNRAGSSWVFGSPTQEIYNIEDDAEWLATIKTWLDENPITICSNLYRPVTYNLTATETVRAMDALGITQQTVGFKFNGIPTDYQEVEYVESPGMCWFDTSFTFDANDDISTDIVFQFLVDKNDIYCAGYGNHFVGTTQYQYGRYGSWYGSGDGAVYEELSTEENPVYMRKIHAHWTLTPSYGTSTAYPWRVFGRTYFTPSEKNTPTCRIWSHSMSINGNKVFDLVPVKRKSDGEVGMFDIITGTFYTNQGTGEGFIAGPEVNTAPTVYGGTVTLNEDGSADLVSKYFCGLIPAEFASTGSWNDYMVGFHYFNKWSIPFPASTTTYIYDKCLNRISFPDDSSLAFFVRTAAGNAPWFRLYVKKDLLSSEDAQGLYEWMTSNPITVLYLLKTPLTYHFPNISQLQSFLGTNNIWHNMNGDITVEYWNKQ